MKIFCDLNKKTIIINEKQQKIINEMIAYHGSKANFDEFNIAYMGSGIGAQEFGEGLYLTFDKETAYGYGGNVYTVDIPNEQDGNYIYYDRPILDEIFSVVVNNIIEDRKLQFPDEYEDEKSINELREELYEVLNPSEGRYLMYNIHRYVDEPIVIANLLKRSGLTGFIYNNGKVTNVIMFSSKDIKILDKEVVSENKEYFVPDELISESLLLEATLDDIYNKYYSNIPQDEFWQIIKADPTYNEQKSQKMGKYGKWLLNLYKQGKLKNEDLYKATDYLSYFVKYYNKIEQKDINKIPDLPSLYTIIEPFKTASDNGEEMATSKSDEIRKIKQDAEKFYEDDTWLVVIPHTQEASCYYGKNTQWCTAATDSYNMFNQYYSKGLLYININKKTNKKYQFHFETSSFMDETDTPISTPISRTIGLTEGLVQSYAKKYGGKAVIILTESIDWDEDEPIEGDDPYFLYVTYDGYYKIVQVNGLNVIPCKGILVDELTSENDPRYAGNGIFYYHDYEDSGYYDEEEDYYYNTDEYQISEDWTIYNAKTGQSVKLPEVSNSMYMLNGKYFTYDNSGFHYLIDVNTMRTVFKSKELIQSVEYVIGSFKFQDSNRKITKYNDDIIALWSFEDGTSKYKVYDLSKKSYIMPPFSTYGVCVREDNNHNEYLAFRNYDTGEYCLILPNGTISEIYK